MNGWLALTRRPGESIQIGEDITVTVVGIESNKVKVAIQAPREIKVLRSEIVDLGICPHCESTDVRAGGSGRYGCKGCSAIWSGVRRRLAA